MTQIPTPTFAGRLARLFTDIIDQAPMSPKEKERLTHFAAFVFLSVVIMASFCVYNLAAGNILLSSLIFLCAASQLFGWLLMCHLPLGRAVYRANGVLFGGLLLYMLVLGGDGGSKSLWLFSFPLVVFFLLGKNEGLIWSTAMLLMACALLLLPLPGFNPFRYGNEFLARFVTVYLFISIVTYWFEYFREYYRCGMETESARLKEVIDALPDAIHLQDSEGRILLCNQAFIATTGLTVEQVLGKREEEVVLRTDGDKGDHLLKLPIKGAGGTIHNLLVRREHLAIRSTGETSERTLDDLDASGEAKPAVTILLVDDDPMVREIGSLMLDNLGFAVLAATDGAEAVALFRAHQEEISLVFCDQIMPRLDGWQTLSALREINPAIPVIMVSGFAESAEMNTDKSVQPQAYLNKPYTMESLHQSISQVLAQGKHPA